MTRIRIPLVTFRVGLCVVLAAAWGCAGGRARTASVVDEPAASAAPHWESVGTSVEGRQIRAWVGGTGARRALFLGAIHGHERWSREPLDALISHLEAHPEAIGDGRVIVIPVANPDGFEKDTRWNANGVDLNRNFPTANFRATRRHGKRPASEPETRALIRLIDAERPDVIVSIHTPVTCVDYDGPALSLAQRMSQCCGLPVRKLGAKPGSLGSFAGVDRRIPIITLELPATPPAESAARRRIRDALLTVFDHEEPGEAK